jgi:uncharacterized repeat protein (TIGR03803 family)
MRKFNWWLRVCGVLLFWAMAAVVLSAQTLTTLYNFNYTDGLNPSGQMVQATNGYLYGTTGGDLVNSDGTIFEMTPSGTLTTITGFGGTAGAVPYAGLIQATNGNLYGTAQDGGANGDGTVFEITPSGTLTTLHAFDGTDGAEPVGGVIQGTNGDFYGTTEFNGANGGGTVFSMTASGTVTTLHSFTGGVDGYHPYAGLVQGTNGDFYGTTLDGGTYGYGVVFKITSTGKLATLYSFNFNDPNGGNPKAGLLFGVNGSGTIFKITPSGTLSLVYSFCSQTSCTDGGLPFAGLIQGSDGNFYGTTYGGGIDGGNGTVFKITSGGTLTTLHSFVGTDGSFPEAALVQDTNGTFYGTTVSGGTGRTGTVFSLSTGLEAFVSLAATSGKEGVKIGILGQGFSKSSVVKFGGTEATGVALSGATYITATVPADALTGKVTVTTGSTTLTSPITFKVLPTTNGFSPESGPVGTPVVITGTGLAQTTLIKFGTVKATSVTINSDTQVTADVPVGAITATIHVTTKGGTATSTTKFIVN